MNHSRSEGLATPTAAAQSGSDGTWTPGCQHKCLHQHNTSILMRGNTSALWLPTEGLAMTGKFGKAFGERLRAARVAACLTQEELAAKVGMATEAYGRFERGRFLPRAERLVAMATALGVSTDALLGITQPGAAANHRDQPAIQRLLRQLERVDPSAVNLLCQTVESLLECGARQVREPKQP